MAKKSAKEGNVLLQPLVIFEEHLAKLLTRQNEVLDLQETAAFLKASEEDVLRMVREQGLPARQVGEGWRFLKAAICEWLRTGTSPRHPGKEALLAMAGAFKDDPDLDSIVEEAMRLRGRSPAEGE
jgi:excisionase family DNA binding protein